MEIIAAAVQMCSNDDLDANLGRVRALGDEAGARGANLIVFPECFAFLGRKEGDKMPIAEVLDDARPGRILSTLADLATRHRAYVIGGGMAERIPGEDSRAYNTAVTLGPDGKIVARYRKIHLFDVDIPGGAVHRESDGTVPGTELVTLPVGELRLGLSICYDVRFPEMYRELTYDQGADVVVVPAAFTAVTGKAHWHILLRARAIESQAWVVAAAQYGRHNEKRETFGHSMVVDPWGTITAELATGDGVVVAPLDKKLVDEVRGRMPSRRHASLWGRGP